MRSRSLPAWDEHDRRPAGETAARDERLRPDQAAVLALSSGAGNQAVARWLLQRQEEAGEVEAEDEDEQVDEEAADEEPGSDADVDFLEAAEVDEVVASASSAEPEMDAEAEAEEEAEPEAEAEDSEPAVLARMPVRSGGAAVLARASKKPKKKRVSNWPLKLPAGTVRTTWTKYRKQVTQHQAVAALVFPDDTVGASGPIVVTVNLPKLTTRADSTLVKASVAAIAKHMNMFSKRLMGIALPKKYKRLAAVTARTIGSWRAKVTEGVGELAATQYVMANFPGYQLISGFGPGRGIDQLWKFTDANGDVEYLVVEAKGPGQDLTGTEMTRAWVKSRARQLGTDDGDEIVDALDGNGDAEVRGVILVARWFKGKLSPTKRWPKGTNKGWYT